VLMRFCMLLSASAASGELSPWPCFVSPTLVDINANGVTAIRGGGMTVLQVCAPSSSIAASPYVAPYLTSAAQLDYVPVDINKLTPSVPSLAGSLRMETVMAWLWTPFAVVVWIAVMEFPWHLLSWLVMEEGVTVGRVIFRLLMLPLMFTAISCLFPGFTHPHVLSLTCIPTSSGACGAVAGVASVAYGRAWTFFIIATIYWLLIAAACIGLAIVLYICCSRGNWRVQEIGQGGVVLREWIEDNTEHDEAVADCARSLVMPVPCCIILAAGMLLIWVLAAPIASIAGNIEVASATQNNKNWPLQPLSSTPIGFSTVIPTQQPALTAVHTFGMLTSFMTMISLAARAAVTIIDKYNPPEPEFDAPAIAAGGADAAPPAGEAPAAPRPAPEGVMEIGDEPEPADDPMPPRVRHARPSVLGVLGLHLRRRPRRSSAPAADPVAVAPPADVGAGTGVAVGGEADITAAEHGKSATGTTSPTSTASGTSASTAAGVTNDTAAAGAAAASPRTIHHSLAAVHPAPIPLASVGATIVVAPAAAAPTSPNGTGHLAAVSEASHPPADHPLVMTDADADADVDGVANPIAAPPGSVMAHDDHQGAAGGVDLV